MESKLFNLVLFVSLLFVCQKTVAQNYRDEDFTVLVTKVTGDLNKDGIEDEVTVLMDTLNEKRPYCIKVYFKMPDGSLEKIVSSFQLLPPQYPEGKNGFRDGHGFGGVEIKKGILLVNNSLMRGGYTYKFRYQNDNFELIGYTYGSSDGVGTIYTTDFNLSTGVYFNKEESYETGKIISQETTKRLIRPLPRLQDIIPFESDWE